MTGAQFPGLWGQFVALCICPASKQGRCREQQARHSLLRTAIGDAQWVCGEDVIKEVVCHNVIVAAQQLVVVHLIHAERDWVNGLLWPRDNPGRGDRLTLFWQRHHTRGGTKHVM